MGLQRGDKSAAGAQVEEEKVEEQTPETPPVADAEASDNSAKAIEAAAAAKKAEKKAPEGSGKFRAVKIKIRDSESNVMYPTTHSVLGPRTDWVLSQLNAGILIEEK